MFFKKKKSTKVNKFEVSGKDFNVNHIINRHLLDIITTNLPTILVVVALITAYISLKFSFQTKLSRIATLKTELENTKSMVISQITEIMTLTNSTDVSQRAKDLQLGLEESTVPPFVIEEEE